MKVLLPPLREIVWPFNRSWMRSYLGRGFQDLTPRDRVTIAWQLERDEPTEAEIDEYIVYTLAKMGFTLSGIREFFSRPDVIPKPDVDSLYARAVAQQHSTSHAPLLGDNPFFEFLRIFRMYLETPAGLAGMRVAHSKLIFINERHGRARINMGRALTHCASEAARRALKMPNPREVIADMKHYCRKDYVIEIANHGISNYYLTLSLDWMLRHDLIPPNLGFSSCVHRKRGKRVR